MFTSTKIDEFRAAVARIEKAKEEALNLARGLAKEAFKEMSDIVFAKYPELQSFSWTQYTPYFNDGEECIFSANIDQGSIEINGHSEDGDDGYENDPWYIASDTYWDDTLKKSLPKQELHPLYNCQKACADLLALIGEEQLKEMFGDHQKITVTRDGVENDYYDHH